MGFNKLNQVPKVAQVDKISNTKTNIIGEVSSNETYYRTMSKADYETLLKSNKVSATSETFISPTESYSRKYGGITVEFKVKSGTTTALEEIGVKDYSSFTNRKYYNMANVKSGWTNNNAYFKYEDLQVNIGLGKGKALDIFNNNIVNFKNLGGK